MPLSEVSIPVLVVIGGMFALITTVVSATWYLAHKFGSLNTQILLLRQSVETLPSMTRVITLENRVERLEENNVVPLAKRK